MKFLIPKYPYNCYFIWNLHFFSVFASFLVLGYLTVLGSTQCMWAALMVLSMSKPPSWPAVPWSIEHLSRSICWGERSPERCSETRGLGFGQPGSLSVLGFTSQFRLMPWDREPPGVAELQGAGNGTWSGSCVPWTISLAHSLCLSLQWGVQGKLGCGYSVLPVRYYTTNSDHMLPCLISAFPPWQRSSVGCSTFSTLPSYAFYHPVENVYRLSLQNLWPT